MSAKWKSYKWYTIEQCDRFLDVYDSCSEQNEYTLPIKLDVPALGLEHLFWCVENCQGKFHRCRIEREFLKPKRWRRVLGVMAFDNKDDAILFRLRWGMEESDD